MLKIQSYFAATIKHLLEEEAVLVYDKLLDVSHAEEQSLANYLSKVYSKEALNYPFSTPAFNKQAAIWGAKIIYFTAQFVLHRSLDVEDFEKVYPKYKFNSKDGIPNASDILSADLCLRFIPVLLKELDRIGPNDPLIPFLETRIKDWHYSYIGFDIADITMSFDEIIKDPCTRQLYVDRVIAKKDRKRAKHPSLEPYVKASLGNYADSYWNNLY